MRKSRVVEQNRCYHLVSRLAHRAFFLDDEEKDCAVALMRRVEAGVKDSRGKVNLEFLLVQAELKGIPEKTFMKNRN